MAVTVEYLRIKTETAFRGLRFCQYQSLADVSALPIQVARDVPAGSPQAKCGLGYMARKPKLGELECEALNVHSANLSAKHSILSLPRRFTGFPARGNGGHDAGRQGETRRSK